MNYKIKLSIVMPFYNTGHYLRRTIKSIIKQKKINFNEIELILINDCDSINSYELVEDLIKKYNWIKYYENEQNLGVSASRNKGIDLAQGEIISFMDSDDTCEELYFYKALKNFNFAKYKMLNCFLEIDNLKTKKKEKHHLYLKKTSIIDVKKSDEIVANVNSSFFLLSEIKKNKVYFLPNVTIGEDSIFLATYMNGEGYIKKINAKYYYTKRLEENSAIDESYKRSEPLEEIEVHLDLIKKHPNNEYLKKEILYINMWRFLDLFDRRGYKFIDENLTQKWIKNFKKLLLNYDFTTIDSFIQKYPFNYDLIFSFLIINNIAPLNHFLKRFKVLIYKTDDNFMYLTFINYFNALDITKFTFNEQKIKCILINDENKYAMQYAFKVSLSNSKKGEFYYDQTPFESKTKLTRGNIVRGNNIYTKSKKIKIKKNQITIQKRNELQYVFDNLNLIKFFQNPYIQLPKSFGKLITSLFLYFFRIFLIISQKLTPKIAIFSDRTNMAGDNSEYFLEYIIEQNKLANYQKYFLLSKNSPDYNRLKTKFKIIQPNTFKYMFLLFCSDLVISSHADDFVTTPFLKSKKLLALTDILKFKFIFLSHGVTRNDVSHWLGLYNKNIDLIITSAQSEYDSFLENERYQYTEENIILSGLPRQAKNNQKDNHEKYILFCPTWRTELAGPPNDLGYREYSYKFANSDYLNNLNKMFNDQNFLKILKNNNLKLYFLPHPNIEPNIDDFNMTSDLIKVIKSSDVNYNEVIANCSIFMTDLSSVHNDAAYYRKPIIHYIFDDLVNNHFGLYGNFDNNNELAAYLKQNMFGDVVINQNELNEKIQKIIDDNYINNQIDKINKDFCYDPKQINDSIVNKIEKMI